MKCGQKQERISREFEIEPKNYEVSKIGKFANDGRSRPIRIELIRVGEMYKILRNAP